ncbi:hypothetical protein D3C87_1338720 [compost metagenome]
MLLKFLRTQNARMLDTFKQTKLQLGCFLEPQNFFLWLALCQVDAHLALHTKLRMQRKPILICVGLIKKTLELIAAHAAHTHRLFNACLFDRPRDHFGRVRSDLSVPPVLIDKGNFTEQLLPIHYALASIAFQLDD